jgi:hypothetical protein
VATKIFDLPPLHSCNSPQLFDARITRRMVRLVSARQNRAGEDQNQYNDPQKGERYGKSQKDGEEGREESSG